MSKIKDITGQKFGKLTVKSFYDVKNRKARWLCDCDCGTKDIVVIGNLLRNGGTKSCGCLNLERKKSRIIDITGEKFGRWVVKGRAEDCIDKDGKTRPMWICDCDCGTKNVLVLGSNLRRGKSLSCGCLVKEINSEIHKKFNTYDLSGDYGIGIMQNGKEFWFDLEDYDKIKDYCWHEDIDGYICANEFKNEKSKNATTKLHRIVMGVTNPKVKIDHIYHNLYDNRKSQLRLATSQENNRNQQLSILNTSGKTGVSKIKNKNKWRAYITINNKQINLGRFNSFEDAVEARLKAEEKYFGEFQYKVSPSPEDDDLFG